MWPGWPLFFNNDFPRLFRDQKNEFPWPIGTAYFFRNKRYTIYECLPEKKYFQFPTTNRMIFTETKILVHFLQKTSRTSSSFSLTFHDFPWPWLFSMTFQAWKMVLLNSMTFQEEWSPCVTNNISHNTHALLSYVTGLEQTDKNEAKLSVMFEMRCPVLL